MTQNRPSPIALAALLVAALGLVALAFRVQGEQAPPPREQVQEAARAPDNERASARRTGTSRPDTPQGSDEDEDEADAQADPVAEANARRADPEAAPAGRGEANPFAVLLDGGQSMTDEAAEKPDMSTVDPSDEAYDPVTEAQQLFRPFEEALRGAQPLDKDSWRSLLTEHADDNRRVLNRANELRKAGHADQATELIFEWNRLYGAYQGQAYGRAPHPVRPPE